MLKTINSIRTIITLDGIDKIKKKNDNKKVLGSGAQSCIFLKAISFGICLLGGEGEGYES